MRLRPDSVVGDLIESALRQRRIPVETIPQPSRSATETTRLEAAAVSLGVLTGERRPRGWAERRHVVTGKGTR